MFYINSAINPILYNTMSSRSLSSSSSLSSLGHSRPSAGMALLDLRVVTSPGEYEGNFNAAELHFECFFQGYPTCLFFRATCHLSPEVQKVCSVPVRLCILELKETFAEHTKRARVSRHHALAPREFETIYSTDLQQIFTKTKSTF